MSGSKIEGTSKYNESDFDYLWIKSSVKATECEDLVEGDNDLTLFMEDNTAPPGYCKLQLLRSGQDNFHHRDFIEHNCYVRCQDYVRPHLSSADVVDMHHNILKQFAEVEKSGPANKGQLPGYRETDNVQAIRCAHMPHSFKTWIRRHQDTDWPTKQIMEEIVRSDIFLVPVGMHDTDQRSLQWRVSFNIPEKILIQNFTTVQHQIYVLLKMIKTEIIEPQCQKSITSYIVKTLMLWAVEQIPAQMWSNRNLIDLLFHVLNLLYRCIKCGFCPMYFIPECNILHGRVTKTTQMIICEILSSLLSDRISCILRLPRIRHQLHQYIFVPLGLRGLYQYIFVPLGLREANDYIEKTNIAMTTARIVHLHSLSITDPGWLLCCAQGQARVLYEDLLTDLVSTPTPAGSEMEKLLKFTFSQTISQLALQYCVDASTLNVSNIHKYRRERRCIRILNGNRSSDVLCGRVRLAQVLCMVGQYKAAQDVLESGADRIRHYMQKLSERRTVQKYVFDQKLINVCENGCVLTSQILKKFFLSDIQYDHHKRLCLPKPLQYEVYRSFEGDRIPLRIDPQTLLYYLQYLCYKSLGQRNCARVAFTNLVSCATSQESNIEYREIALNVLGHCLMKRRLYDKAARVLVKSVKLVNQYQHLRPMLRAVHSLTPDITMWHIAILLYKVHRNS